MHEVGRILLHPVDEDEAPGVLELALHGEQVEERDELLAIQAWAAFGLEALQILGQHLVDERAIELDVAVAEERDQVVLQWTSRARTRDGRPYENGCIGVFTIRDGRIQDVREYMDTLYASEVAFTDPVRPKQGGR